MPPQAILAPPMSSIASGAFSSDARWSWKTASDVSASAPRLAVFGRARTERYVWRGIDGHQRNHRSRQSCIYVNEGQSLHCEAGAVLGLVASWGCCLEAQKGLWQLNQDVRWVSPLRGEKEAY